jgi:hypothetical protein
MVGGARKLPPYARRPRYSILFKSNMKLRPSRESARVIVSRDRQFLDAV